MTNAANNDPLLNRDTTAGSSMSSSTSSPTSSGQLRPSVSSDTKVTTGGLSAQATKIESHAINSENSSVIGPIGGVIEVGGGRLVIGQNALDSEVRITLKSVYGGNEVKEGLITTLLRCEPSDLKFKKEVLVRLYTCYVTDEPALVQVRRSKDGKQWENIKQLPHTDKSFFEFSIKGFSWFAVWLKNFNDCGNSRKRKSLPSGNRPVNTEIRRCSVDDDVPRMKKKPVDNDVPGVKKNPQYGSLQIYAATGNISINVQSAYGDIAGGSITRAVINQQTMERDLNPAATEFPTTSSSHGSLSSQAFTNNNVSPVQSAERKPTLQDIFYPQGQFSLPSNVQAARDLLEKYKSSLKNQNFTKAETFRAKIVSLIVNDGDTKADDVKLFGGKLLKEKKYLESIAIFDAAAILFSKMINPAEDLEKMETWVCGMKEANEAMIGEDANNKGIVREHVIPIMRKWLRQMQNTSQVSVKWRCLQVSWVLHHIEQSEYLVDQWEEREQTLRCAITGMKEVFGSDVSRDHGRLLGFLLNNLGHVCEHTSRFEEAASFYKQAIDAYKAATSYSDEKERKEKITLSETNLKNAQLKL